MLTRDQYIKGAKERRIPEETINRVLAKKQFESYSQPLEAQISDKTGLFDIPVAGFLLRDLVSSGESYGRMVGGAGYELQRGARSAMGDTSQYGVDEQGKQKQNPFLNEQELQTFSNPSTAIPEAYGRTLNAGLTAAQLNNPLGILRTGTKTVGAIR